MSARESVRSTSAWANCSCALACASWAFAWARATSKGRLSMRKSNCPFFTWLPGSNGRAVTSPVTRACRAASCCEMIVPV